MGGVYLAARRGGQRDYRVLAVRGLSDIVGYKRNAEWTTFACHSAAAFAYALIVNGIIPASSSSNRKQASQSGQSPAKPTADRHRPESEPSDSLAIWREKLTYLESQEAIAADPAQKFALKKQLEEARKKIGELGGSC